MGQVPEYGILGGGRVATHFARYFTLEKIPFMQWSRKSKEGIEPLENCPTVLLLISDGAIEKVASENKFLSSKRLVHFSGSLWSERIWGAHPLMTFSESLYDLEIYRQIPFVTDENLSFEEVFPKLRNPSFKLKKEQKALYHAMCVLSGNFSSLLWEKFFQTLETQFNIPRSAAFPYMQRNSENLQSQGERALTGPLIRKDLTTIKRNLRALQDDPFSHVYKAFLDIYLPGVKL